MQVKELAHKLTDALKREGIIKDDGNLKLVEQVLKNAIHAEYDLAHLDIWGNKIEKGGLDSVPNDAIRD